jgi:hypothetical protein
MVHVFMLFNASAILLYVVVLTCAVMASVYGLCAFCGVASVINVGRGGITAFWHRVCIVSRILGCVNIGVV